MYELTFYQNVKDLKKEKNQGRGNIYTGDFYRCSSQVIRKQNGPS